MSSPDQSKRSALRSLLIALGAIAGIGLALRFCWPLGGGGPGPEASGPEGTLVIFHAGSLTVPFADLAKASTKKAEPALEGEGDLLAEGLSHRHLLQGAAPHRASSPPFPRS